MKEPENVEVGLSIGNEIRGSDDKLVRASFRLPVKRSDGIVFKHLDRLYDVVNFSKKGIAIHLTEGKNPFVAGEMLTSAQLKLRDETVRATFRVTSFYDDEDENPVCGLSFVDPDVEAERRIDKIYWHLRKQLFSDE